MPQHPECDRAEEPISDEADGDPSVTVVYTGCPGGVTVERVVQVTANRLLWVQVRSADRATANAVLDGVDHPRPLPSGRRAPFGDDREQVAHARAVDLAADDADLGLGRAGWHAGMIQRSICSRSWLDSST